MCFAGRQIIDAGLGGWIETAFDRRTLEDEADTGLGGCADRDVCCEAGVSRGTVKDRTKNALKDTGYFRTLFALPLLVLGSALAFDEFGFFNVPCMDVVDIEVGGCETCCVKSLSVALLETVLKAAGLTANVSLSLGPRIRD